MVVFMSPSLGRLSIDCTTGEPELHCHPDPQVTFGGTHFQLENEVVDEDDVVETQYSVPVFMSESISDEERTVLDAVERTIYARRVAAILLQRWWRLNHRTRHKGTISQHSQTGNAHSLNTAGNEGIAKHSLDIFRAGHHASDLHTQQRPIDVIINANQDFLLPIAERKKQASILLASRLCQSAMATYIEVSRTRDIFHHFASSQAAISVFVVYHEMQRKRLSALVLQRHLRRRKLRYRFRTFVQLSFQYYSEIRSTSASIIQRRFRSKLERRQYLCTFRSSHTCQSALLAYSRSCRARHVIRCAISCQGAISTFGSFLQMQRQILGALIIQSRLRRRRIRSRLRQVVQLCYQRHSETLARHATCLQALWRGSRVRRLMGGPIRKLHICAVAIQKIWRGVRARKKFKRLKKHVEIDMHREAVFAQLNTFPDSNEFHLQSLRKQYTERLAAIEFNTGLEAVEPSLAAPSSSANVLSRNLITRTRLFRVKAQIDLIKNNGVVGDAVSPTSPAAQASKSVKWQDDAGAELLDTHNYSCSPTSNAAPAKPCIRRKTIMMTPRRTRVQRMGNVLATTLGKARRCKLAVAGDTAKRVRSPRILSKR